MDELLTSNVFSNISYKKAKILGDTYGSQPTKKVINQIEIMHGRDVVIRYDLTMSNITVVNPGMLPFSLRKNSSVTRDDVTDWINRRLSNLKRTYMNRIYLLRKVGRDQKQIIADSSAVSVIDNFWIRRPDTRQYWDEILSIKDMNKDLIDVALEGKIKQGLMMKAFDDVTSLFTIKGAFPKVPFANTIMKKGCNAEYEIVGYEIGKALGVNAAYAEDVGGGIVACSLFTDQETSMFHIDDIRHLTDESDYSRMREFVYAYFLRMGRYDIVKSLERLFILSYVTANFDLHEENFGVLYDAKTFEWISLAPAYDFNDAFQPWDDPKLFHQWELLNLGMFLEDNLDIVQNIPLAKKVVNESRYLNDLQKKCTLARLHYLQDLV